MLWQKLIEKISVHIKKPGWNYRQVWSIIIPSCIQNWKNNVNLMSYVIIIGWIYIKIKPKNKSI